MVSNLASRFEVNVGFGAREACPNALAMLLAVPVSMPKIVRLNAKWNGGGKDLFLYLMEIEIDG